MAISLKDIDGAISAEPGDDKSIGLALKWVALYKKGVLAAPNKVFPIDTVARIYERAALSLESFSKKTLREPYTLASAVANAFIDSYYSFNDNLRTGHYAPYLHEKKEFDLVGDNCTTIIPEAYLFCEAVGLKPEIVQFFDFKDIKTKKDEEEAASPSHFSLIIDVGRKHRYFFDPFYHTFGPIRKQGEDYLAIGKCQGRPARKRTFRKILPYSAQDFVAMMDRLHDPAESLDMLVAGQRVQVKTVAKKNCTYMIYYHDESNTVSTRLYVPQKPLTDKAIYARMTLNDEGDVSRLLLEGYLAKDHGWTSLVDPKKIFETDFSTARSLRRKLHGLKNKEGKKFRLQDHERIASALSQADEKERGSLLRMADKMYQALSAEEKKRLHPLILARTLYESERPAEKYLYTSEQHDARLLEKATYEKDENLKMKPLDDLLYFHGWRLKKLKKDELQKITRTKRRHGEKMQEIVEEINALNSLRHNDKKAYSRAMDKVLFSEALKGRTLDDLEKMVLDRTPDPRIGYLAMVADFIPFMLEGQEDLELRSYRQPIKEKVAARMKKKAAALQGPLQIPLLIHRLQLDISSGLELAVAE